MPSRRLSSKDLVPYHRSLRADHVEGPLVEANVPDIEERAEAMNARTTFTTPLISEAAGGLKIRIDQLMNGLTNPNLLFQRRLELQEELSRASKGLDAAEKALQGIYPRHPQ